MLHFALPGIIGFSLTTQPVRTDNQCAGLGVASDNLSHSFVFFRKQIGIVKNHMTKIFVASLFLAVSAFARPVPAILDTDIGDDIDDTWALGLLLKSPNST